MRNLVFPCPLGKASWGLGPSPSPSGTTSALQGPLRHSLGPFYTVVPSWPSWTPLCSLAELSIIQGTLLLSLLWDPSTLWVSPLSSGDHFCPLPQELCLWSYLWEHPLPAKVLWSWDGWEKKKLAILGRITLGVKVWGNPWYSTNYLSFGGLLRTLAWSSTPQNWRHFRGPLCWVEARTLAQLHPWPFLAVWDLNQDPASA